MSRDEQNLIDRIKHQIPSFKSALLLQGIGDDSALIYSSRQAEWAISCDQFIEGVHFLTTAHAPEVVGYKALARATSDLAAMGARPRFFLLSLMLPASHTGRWFDRMLAGMARAARNFRMALAGGDTSRSPGEDSSGVNHVNHKDGRIAFSITVLGEVGRGRAIRRSGARPGDAIVVTGQLGAAQLGLEIVLRGLHHRGRWKTLLAVHNCPRPRIEIGLWLARHRMASAMIDISDGLSSDLMRLCRASGVSARISEPSLPRIVVPETLQSRGIDARALALHGGEDYELLFTVPKRKISRMPAALYGVHLTRIGDVLPSGRNPRIQLISATGNAAPLLPRGWDPFAAKRGPGR